MLIKFRHPGFSHVELRDGSLMLHSMQGKARVLQENVEHVAVAVQNELVRIVGFIDRAYAWYFSGEDDLQVERIEFGQTYAGGGRLINDGGGNSHLFYFVKQSLGHGCQLRHQTFSEKWSTPQTVSINVFGELSSFSASWHRDQHVHLVYCGHKDQHLLYRVYNLEHRLWSGAVVFSEERCSYPQFIPTHGGLNLFWQEDTPKTALKVRHKEQCWSEIVLISSGEHHASSVGYRAADDQWSVLWGEEAKFYEAPFGDWSNRKEVQRGDFDYAWVVQGSLTVPIYEPKQEPEALESKVEPKALAPEPTPEPKLEPALEVVPSAVTAPPVVESAPQVSSEAEAEVARLERAQKKRDNEQAKLQAAFMEQAFRTLQEWEKVKDEMGRWQREFKLPEPVDLAPIINRLERLERRFLSLQQNQEQSKKQTEDSFAQMEQALVRMRAQLRDLEDPKETKQRSLWDRVLGRR